MGDGLVSLHDIMQPYVEAIRSGNRQRLQELFQEGEEAEKAFRRGYHQAWDTALQEIFAMLDEEVSIKDARAVSALYVNSIAAWRAKAADEMTPPPSFERNVLLEALRRYREEQEKA